ncbi:hypothetical protein [Wenzhouxiangella sp. EGI_FJ10305]|uniref:hypothetical protein n=1 Tax=Wenzhouxiangella sp. EGI_FJ10305 TaxID=3243768 RepID=UPI0035DE4630
MDWLIHIGTEKTGSSHIQSLLALSRDSLTPSGIAFPRGDLHDERCMRKGQISAGNAKSLAKALSISDEAAAKAQVHLARRSTVREGLNRVVLSSEWLLSSLAEGDNARRLVTLLNDADASSISFLLVLRDPLEQCLSLYKHRAKGGTAGTIADWLKTGYQLPFELRAVRQKLDELDCELVVRGLGKEPGTLERLFFDDWLGVPAPAVELPATVNPSLTLSELVLIRQMAEVRPDLVPSLYDALVAVPGDDKIQGEALEAHARAVAAQAVAMHAEEWSAWNERLPQDEQLCIPDSPVHMPPAPKELGLSERQMQAVSALLGKAATPQFIAQVFWRSQVRPALGRIKRRLLGQ